MTIVRTPGSVEEALHRIIGETPPDALECATGVAIDQLRKWSNPNMPGRLPLQAAMDIDAMLADSGKPARFLALAQADLRRRRMAHQPADIADVVAAHLRASAHSGGFAERILAAVDDGHLCHAERREIAASAQRLIDEIQAIRDRVLPIEPMAWRPEHREAAE